MADARGENEGFRMLPECSGAAIPEPGAIPQGAKLGRGANEGMYVLDEVLVDLSSPPPASEPPPLLGELTEPQRTALRVLAQSGSLADVARVLGSTPAQARATLLAAVDSLRARLAG
jgi:hypothetical protein